MTFYATRIVNSAISTEGTQSVTFLHRALPSKIKFTLPAPLATKRQMHALLGFQAYPEGDCSCNTSSGVFGPFKQIQNAIYFWPVEPCLAGSGRGGRPGTAKKRARTKLPIIVPGVLPR